MNLDVLKRSISSGKRHRYVFFWSHKPKTPGVVGAECFSQWYGAPFDVDGVRYPTAEHFMMAGKARLFGDDENLRRILEAGSPGAAKAMGRKVRGFQEDRWVERRFDIVVEANLAKFGQHAELRNYLLGTKARVLVEASPNDRIWGIGLEAADPRAENPLQWQGLNLLGFALMEIRSRLAKRNG